MRKAKFIPCSASVILLAFLIQAVAGENLMKTNNIYEIRGHNRWFPDDGKTLSTAVHGYMDSASIPLITGEVVAAIAPHAGYAYSGPVAGYTFRALRDATNNATGTPATVVVLGFTHQMSFPGIALLNADAVQTGIGLSSIDKEGCSILTNSSSVFHIQNKPHASEHSANNEIPFVQAAHPSAGIIIGLMGDHNHATLDGALKGLLERARHRTVIVIASTDLLHDADYDKVTRTDKDTLSKITALDRDGLVHSWHPQKQVCCGIMPVLTAMSFARARGAKNGILLHYRNSGDDYPESRGQWVVGYGAVLFTALPGAPLSPP